ncbi:hypothetical protein CNBG_4870 [Cryptococcus deuterogattii R265]|uniref:C2H2-type domain-containing protein n=1 Tax=Cryptococcus deuterogattii (strain R265) TaxID=294750 RepID=A0A095CFP5_CRYD2|nr:hypothetical protein CNBG_4870 [Cryptococcus deuterogattii R265]KIR70935.1 hypothetical protein I310_05347 [Cryptococcus deuterogattii CA1014]
MPPRTLDTAREDYNHHHFTSEQSLLNHYPAQSHHVCQPEHRYYRHPYVRHTPYAAPPPPPPIPCHPQVSPLKSLQSQVQSPSSLSQMQNQNQGHGMRGVGGDGKNQRIRKSAFAPAPASKPSSGRYQPSRGAQRDAKHSQRMHLQVQRSYADKKAKEKENKNKEAKARPVAVDSSEPKTEDGQPKTFPTYTTHAPPPPHPFPLSPPIQGLDLEVIRREQRCAAVEEARRKLMERVKMEEEKQRAALKKITNIQLQVFVHARETRCQWGECEAILNSWAVLEKHISQSHFHSDRTYPKKVVNGVRRLQCLWKDNGECQETFKTRNELHQHVLVLHMKSVSARCPFDGCEYTGHDFNQLMWHIDSTHSTAIPDDLIPGLIHFRPPHSSSSPSLTHPLPSDLLPSIQSLSQTVALPSYEAPGNRMKKWVSRRCRSGKRPRIQVGSAGYEVRKGAQMAIKLCTENVRRMRLGLPPASEEEANGEAKKEVKEAKKEAAKEAGVAISKPQSGGLIVIVSDQDLTPFTSVNPSQNSSPLNKHRQSKTSLVISPFISLSSDSDQAAMSDDFVNSAI